MNNKIAFYSQINASFQNGFKCLFRKRRLNRKSNSKAPALRCIIISELIVPAKWLVCHVEGYMCAGTKCVLLHDPLTSKAFLSPQ